MHVIPDEKDKVKALYTYLYANKDEYEVDAWHDGHNHHIVHHINSFSNEECARLQVEMWNWDKDLLEHLGDPLLDIHNPHLNGFLLYCKIFLHVEDIDIEQYLLPNIHLVHQIPKGTQPLEFYYKLRDKVLKVVEIVGDNHSREVNDVLSKVATEESYQAKGY